MDFQQIKTKKEIYSSEIDSVENFLTIINVATNITINIIRVGTILFNEEKLLRCIDIFQN